MNVLKYTKDTRTYTSIMAVNLIRVKESTAADLLGVDRGTVGNWLAAYDDKRLDGLVDETRSGRPPFVPRKELKKMVG